MGPLASTYRPLLAPVEPPPPLPHVVVSNGIIFYAGVFNNRRLALPLLSSDQVSLLREVVWAVEVTIGILHLGPECMGNIIVSQIGGDGREGIP